jgi:hypothetical protein
MPSYPNRCQRIKINGTQCGSPALRCNRFCYFHKRHHDERIELHADRQKNVRARRRTVAIDLPVFEDANSIQVSLMQITRLLIAGDIDAKTAGLILYALQTASSNLHRTRFEPHIHDVILDPASVGEIALGAHAWDDSDFLDDDENGEPDDGIDPNRRAGIMKAAEYLYELDRKAGGIRGFAPKPISAPDLKAKPDSKTTVAPKTQPDPKTKKSPASELRAAEVREQIRQQVIKAAPALLAANPSFLQSVSKKLLGSASKADGTPFKPAVGLSGEQ